MKIKAFISHSSVQKQFVLELVNLIGRDFCIVDCYDLEPAYKSLDEIYDKIDKCSIFVLLLSRESLKSDWVSKEISAAVKKFKPLQLRRFWPYIIDPSLPLNECPEWMRKDECFNLRLFKSPEILRHDIEQKVRQLIWEENPAIKARETQLIGRQEELGLFEGLRFSRNGRELRALIISGRTGVGKDAFARQCLYTLGRPKETEPYRVSLEKKSSIEDFVIQLNLIAKEYNDTQLRSELSKDIHRKVDLAVILLNTLIDSQAVIFVDDNMACVLPNREIPEWLNDIVNHEKLNKQLSLFIKSKISPTSYLHSNRIAHIQLHPLKKDDRKKLFYSLIEHYDVQNISERDADFFVDKLLHSPAQIHQAVLAIKQQGVVMAKKDIGNLVTVGDEKAKPLIDHFRERELSFQLLVVLSRFEFLGFDVLEELFPDNIEELQSAIADLMVYGILTTFGLSGEYVRLDHFVCNYINRNRIALPRDLESQVCETVEKHVLSANITKDVSIYFYDLRQKIISGHISPDSYIVPSVIIKAIIEAYDKQEYVQVIEICDHVLNDCHNYYAEINRELTYWLCLSLCRTIKKRESNKERFWNLVKTIDGADAPFLKGFFFRNEENYERAEKYLYKALELYPDMDRAKRELVTVLLAQKKYEDALSLARENYERSNGENTYHVYAYFRCLVRKSSISHDELLVLKELMSAVRDSYSDKKDELLAAMEIDYSCFVDHKSPLRMVDLIKEAKRVFPDGLNVKRAADDYLRRQGIN